LISGWRRGSAGESGFFSDFPAFWSESAMDLSRFAGALAALALAATVILGAAGCYTRVAPKSGKPFNYDNHKLIERGRTTKAQVRELLAGQPVDQGKDGARTFEVYRCEEVRVQGSYLNPVAPNVENIFREAVVYYDADGRVVDLRLKATGGEK
jgi:hypothetical protein